ncbi:hypothetical protein O6H91_08G006200 [Diphasiastrum complanatum]|uniref:Uncharacterized protein n=1 Tax=Diphasiastrum complanatum TaxID=34168 RepID=A0ACC2CUX6_DIPCM|nr:hypothetical protein O6H91_08G006200 [Diphasiastrum complanatum]
MDSRLSRESIADRERNSGSVRDYVVVILIAVACVPFIVANFVIIINCNFKPVKTRNASLTVMSSLGGLIWLGATIVVNDHFERREHTVWTICPLWTFWLQACFGFALWLNCMTLHLVRLYILLIRKKNLDKRNNVEWITTRLLLLLSPTIVACICATAFRAIRFKAQLSPVKEAHRKGDCEIQKSVFSAILISLLPLYFVIFLGFAFKLRNIMAQYNEFRQIRNGGIMSLFLYLLYLVTLQTKLYIQPVGRCFIALSVAGAVFYYFWARNGEIVYNVLFNKLEYEKKFLDDLNRSSYRQRSKYQNTYIWELLRKRSKLRKGIMWIKSVRFI